MTFTDEDLKKLKESLKHYPGWATEQSPEYWRNLLIRLEAAEEKECNQFHCGHASCNVWRNTVGK